MLTTATKEVDSGKLSNLAKQTTIQMDSSNMSIKAICRAPNADYPERNLGIVRETEARIMTECRIAMNKAFAVLRLLILITITFPFGASRAMEGGQEFQETKSFAKSITIGIETPSGSGSGIIIGKKGSMYFFLTAAHVVTGNPENEEFYAYSAQSSKPKRYRILSFEKPKDWQKIDATIGSFESDEELAPALIFPLETTKHANGYRWQPLYNYNGRTYNDAWGIQGPISVAGVSIPTRAVTVPIFRSSTIRMLDRANGNQNGYEAIYTATSTVPGMSGGPVFGARICRTHEAVAAQNFGSVVASLGVYPGVIAMHGMSEEYLQSGGRSGTSLAIPLDLLVSYLGDNQKKYGILTGESYTKRAWELCSASKE